MEVGDAGRMMGLGGVRWGLLNVYTGDWTGS